MTGGKRSPAGRRSSDRTLDSGAASPRPASDQAVDRYAVVGNPVAHSKSPLIQEAFARATGQRMRYERLLAPLDGFAETVRTFAEANGFGLNVTIPFKLQAFALARERSTRAQSARACNTLAWRGDHWFGDNTDGAGVVRDLTRNLGETIAGRKLLVLGAGGAARGIAGALLAELPLRLVIANRTHARAVELAAQFEREGPVSAAPLASLSGQQFDIVVNATSLGLGTSVPAGLWPHRLFAAQAIVPLELSAGNYAAVAVAARPNYEDDVTFLGNWSLPYVIEAAARLRPDLCRQHDAVPALGARRGCGTHGGWSGHADRAGRGKLLSLARHPPRHRSCLPDAPSRRGKLQSCGWRCAGRFVPCSCC